MFFPSFKNIKILYNENMVSVCVFRNAFFEGNYNTLLNMEIGWAAVSSQMVKYKIKEINHPKASFFFFFLTENKKNNQEKQLGLWAKPQKKFQS
jgi:hypothetical protein